MLSKHDRLRGLDGKEVHIRSATRINRQNRVWNLHVDNTHVYFVGRDGVLVHNKRP